MKGPRFESCVTLNVEMLSSALKIELLYVSVGELEKHFCSNYFHQKHKIFFFKGSIKLHNYKNINQFSNINFYYYFYFYLLDIQFVFLFFICLFIFFLF